LEKISINSLKEYNEKGKEFFCANFITSEWKGNNSNVIGWIKYFFSITEKDLK